MMNSDSDTLDSLDGAFCREVLRRIDVAKRQYNVNRQTLRRMIVEHGGRDTARRLKRDYPDHNSDGYADLALAGALNLTLEAIMLEPSFQPLFDQLELEWAREVAPA